MVRQENPNMWCLIEVSKGKDNTFLQLSAPKTPSKNVNTNQTEKQDLSQETREEYVVQLTGSTTYFVPWVGNLTNWREGLSPFSREGGVVITVWIGSCCLNDHSVLGSQFYSLKQERISLQLQLLSFKKA